MRSSAEGVGTRQDTGDERAPTTLDSIDVDAFGWEIFSHQFQTAPAFDNDAYVNISRVLVWCNSSIYYVCECFHA